jgi:catechol 2,3-dioxygenase-like lactoylglutathione lyase family enzyme
MTTGGVSGGEVQERHGVDPRSTYGRDWYVKHFEMTCATETTRFVLLEGDGGAAIGFDVGEPLANPSAVQFHVEVDDLDRRFESMRASGVDFDGEPTVQPWGVRSVSCLDPGGHSVELVEAGHSRPAAEASLASQSIGDDVPHGGDD